MYLKSLHVVGFKSFADRTTLEFNRGITAIVGPNGCGKSNVLDSIRWVLGEQSAKALRGDEMKDVIFSGTEARPPLGMAEVSLTFGDCEEQLGVEYNEVTITRRVFRDGAGEYEINKTPCRLRDIHSLFMDTGIGRTAYSIMEQGKIDQILSSRPEDRRAVFDEAAGITKYKSQKKEAMRKLENTEANLLRLADIIREVKRQIGSLQRQAGKARRYQAAFDELAALESRLGRHQFETYSKVIADLQSEVDGTREHLETLEANIGTQEGKVRQAREFLAGTESELGRLREDLGAIRHALERAEQKAATNEARVGEFNELRRQAQQEIAGTEEKVRVAEEHLAGLKAQMESLARDRDDTRRRLEARQREAQALALELESAESEAADAAHEKARYEQQRQRQEQELAALELQQQSLRIRLENLHSTQSGLHSRREAMELAQSRAAARLLETQAALEKLQSAWQQALEIRREADESFRLAEEARREAGHAHQKLLARRDALRQLEEQHASAPHAAQRLLKARGEAHDLHGTLAEHISVQPGYEAPLALLLGDSLNALVLEDGACAQVWREKLAAREQCAFAPLHSARPAPLSSSGETHASRFVVAQPLVSRLISALLEEAHVVENLAAAWALKAAQPQCTVATRAGELITRGGLLLVGQDTGASLAVLTRKAELLQLASDEGRLAAELSATQDRAEAARAMAEKRAQAVEAARGAMQEAEVNLAQRRQEDRATQIELTQAVREADEAARELHRLQAQVSLDDEKRQGLRDSILATKASEVEAEARLAQSQEQVDSLSADDAAIKATVTEVRIELATLTQQGESVRQQGEPLVARLQELRDLIRQRRHESEEHERRVTQARGEIALALQEKEEQTAAQSRAAAQLESAQARRTEILAGIEAEELALKALRREQADLHQARSKNEVKLAEQKLFFHNLRERFQREYHKELEDLPPLPEQEIPADWSALEAEVSARRAALDAIGPVNLEAITEYDELEQRHQFLSTQEKDLLGARDQILKAIQEINRTTQKLFAETFVQVQKNFQEMFSELFGGGKASLALMDESDPLKSGIEILARPPGKQNQNVSLLSGGERTMTAVALLFAIYMVKPSPFCVLDELDAPLDESNINRFIKIVQRFVPHSQFVIITHNKRTISMADVLYGVTMEERGISRFVSMRLQREKSVAPSAAVLADAVGT
jgi:chromosome segregation protein